MKKNYLLIITGFVIALNIAVIYRLNKVNQSTRELRTVAAYQTNEIDKLHILLDQVVASPRSTLNYNNLVLKEGFSVRGDYGSNNITLKKIMETQNAEEAIIVRLNENNCSICINETVKKLKSLNTDQSMFVIILASFETPLAFKDLGGDELPIPIYFIDGLLFDTEQTTDPVVFMINKDLRVFNSILPNREYYQIITDYIKSNSTDL